VLVGRLNKRARHVLGLTCMQKAWPSVLQKWVLTGWIGERWITYYSAGTPHLTKKPPRIDHVLRLTLGHGWFPLYGPWLLPDGAHVTDLHRASSNGQTISIG
jgi:hypothetical protein